MSTVDRAAFLRGLIGKPYAPGGLGPAAFDCYGLTRHVQGVLFGRVLPEGRDVEARGSWALVETPIEGDVVLMGAAGDHHVGTWVAPGAVLHAMEPKGWKPGDKRPAVALETRDVLRFRGFTKLRFYRPA